MPSFKSYSARKIFPLFLIVSCLLAHSVSGGTFAEDSLHIAAFYEKVNSGDSAGAHQWLLTLSENPDDELARKANFLLAKTAFDVGDFDGVLEALALGIPKPLYDWGMYLHALAYLEIGRTTNAAENFSRLASDTTSALAEEGLWRLSSLAFEKGYIDSTIRLTNRYRVRFPNGPYRQDIEILKASALVLLKEYESAVECLYRAELMGPMTDAGKKAELKRLAFKQLYAFEPRNLSLAETERYLEALAQAHAYKTATLWINEHLSRARSTDFEDLLLYWKGSMFSRRGKREQALSALTEHQQKFPHSPHANHVLYERGRLAYLRNEDSLAVACLSSVSERGRDSERVLDALKLLGILHADAGDLKKARAAFKKLAKYAEGQPAEMDALWRLGWVLWDLSSFAKAEKTWARLYELGKETHYEPATLYWRGRCCEKMDKHTRAREFFSQTRALFPYAYYSLWAGKKSPKDPPDTLAWELPSFTPFHCHADSAAGTHLKKVCLFDHLRLPDLALREWPALQRELGESPGLWWQQAKLLDDAGDRNQAWLVIRNHLRLFLSRAEANAPDQFWRIAYPLDFDDIVRRQTRAQNLDPYFVLGLICQESRFQAGVASGAGAIGLMQLMPPTARRLSRSTGMKYSRSKLIEPEYNIKLGTTYLAELFEMFDDSVLVLAAYNAGESAAQAWDAEFGGEMDVFVEHIPYRETRLFVKYVLQHIAAYRRLYPDL